MDKLKVIITNDQKAVKIPAGLRLMLRRCCTAVLRMEQFQGDAEVNITFTNDEKIREMNNQFRHIDAATDVLSFPLGENGEYDINPDTGCKQLGDIVISVEHAVAQANEFGHTFEREMGYLTVHSMLHLLGYGIDWRSADFARLEEEVAAKVMASFGAMVDNLLKLGFRVDAGAVLAAADGKPPTGELIAEVMLSDANCHTPPLRPYMEGGERSDMPYINFYLDYFAQGRPAFVPVEYMDYRDAVELVRDNGGVPVVAHPGLNFRGREETAGRLLDRGAAGLEVFNNYHTPEQAVYFTSLALSKGASMTCGSDFHGKTKPRIAVGRFPSDSRFDGRLSDFVNHIHVIGRQGV